MKPLTRKLLLTGAGAATAALGEVALQLKGGELNVAQRAALIGSLLLVVIRVAGAVLAAVPMPAEPTDGAA